MGGKINLAGDLVAHNLAEVLVQVKSILAAADASKGGTELSLKGLKQSNSICLSFILCCMRYAAKNQQKVYFTNIPKDLNNLISAYNLKDVLKDSIKGNIKAKA